ncbi:MAG: hypothetical protein LIP77_10440, partial [Planctomycetes bacterium]|nr:hypothetical protein [Planctomycetota bacterium]
LRDIERLIALRIPTVRDHGYEETVAERSPAATGERNGRGGSSGARPGRSRRPGAGYGSEENPRRNGAGRGPGRPPRRRKAEAPYRKTA